MGGFYYRDIIRDNRKLSINFTNILWIIDGLSIVVFPDGGVRQRGHDLRSIIDCKDDGVDDLYRSRGVWIYERVY